MSFKGISKILIINSRGYEATSGNELKLECYDVISVRLVG